MGLNSELAVPGHPFGSVGPGVDGRVEARVGNIYRAVKQMPAATLLGVLVPFLLVAVLLVVPVYLYLRSRLIRDVESGEISVGDHMPAGVQGGLSTRQKYEYICNNEGRLWWPLVILVGGIACLAIAAAFSTLGARF